MVSPRCLVFLLQILERPVVIGAGDDLVIDSRNNLLDGHAAVRARWLIGQGLRLRRGVDGQQQGAGKHGRAGTQKFGTKEAERRKLRVIKVSKGDTSRHRSDHH